MLRNSRLFSTSAKDRLLNIQSALSDNVLSGYNQLKGSLIQAMAHRMNAKDKAELIQYWGEDAKIIETSVSKSAKSTETPKIAARVLPTPKFDLDGPSEESTLFHPVLGEKLADLGYKTLYLTNVRSLATAPIWKKQRILRPERAQLIANDKIKNNLGSSLSGSISFFLDKKTKEFGIIDGQHRAGALMILAQKGYWDEKARNILIEVFSTSSQVQVGALFREINAAEPVRLVDLLMQEEAPLLSNETNSDTSTTRVMDNKANSKLSFEESASTASTLDTATDSQSEPTSKADNKSKSTVATKNKEKGRAKDELDTDLTESVLSQEALVAVLDEAVDGLAASYPDMFKPSSRCKPPHLNADVLRDDLFQSEFLSRHDVRSAEDLRRLLDSVNHALGQQHEQAAQKPQDGVAGLSKSAAAASKKAAEYGFYLGLDKAWMYLTHPFPPAGKTVKA
mmetsp:Transcript_4123/g.6889  ORF Transcript_4123/g.6889 Transcript_4123/m.6889 type:complete len:453 (-) Transcript_4123:84-1442(-)